MVTPIIIPVEAEKACVVVEGIRYCEESGSIGWPDALWAQALALVGIGIGSLLVLSVAWLFIAMFVAIFTGREIWPLRGGF